MTTFESDADRKKRIDKLFRQGPVLRGRIYCSPWCGGDCTKAAHDDCVRKAKALAKRMGKGWEIRVHENLGWFYEVYKGDPRGSFGIGMLEITPPQHPGGTYSAWIQSTPQFIAHHKDPKIALREALKKFYEYIEGLQDVRLFVASLLDKN